MNEFLKEFNGIRVGGKIKLKKDCFCINKIDLKNFFLYIINERNCFTVETIHKFEDDVTICVHEVNGILNFNQVEPINSRILNWRKL